MSHFTITNVRIANADMSLSSNVFRFTKSFAKRVKEIKLEVFSIEVLLLMSKDANIHFNFINVSSVKNQPSRLSTKRDQLCVQNDFSTQHDTIGGDSR